MKVKTKLIIIGMVLAISVSSLKALPACTDCEALYDVCYATVEAAFDNCIDAARKALSATLDAINQAEADAISICDNDFDQGSIAHSACVQLFWAAASAQAGAARATYHILAHLCRISQNYHKYQCDRDYVACVTGVTRSRANCECQ